MISTRYSVALAALTSVALVPVVVHDYAGIVREDCASVGRLLSETPESAPGERGRFLAKRFRATHWVEGRVVADPAFRYTYLRTYDAKRAYYRPEQSLIEEADPARRAVDWIDTPGGRLPVHRPTYAVRPDEITQLVAGYVLVYAGIPVSNPYVAQLESAAARLVTGRAPMTLLFVHTRVPIDGARDAEVRLQEHLRSAFAAYERTCRVGGDADGSAGAD